MTDTYLYTRVSSQGQTTDPQILALQRQYPHAKVISEIASGVKNRPLLKALMQELRSGDSLVVFSLDRLGRKTSEVLTILEGLEARGVNFISVREGVDFRTPVGRLVLSILAAVATMEREMLRERTMAGLAAAKAKGRLGGRPRTIPRETLEMALSMVKSGLKIREAARRLGISHTRIAREIQKQQVHIQR